MMRAFFPASTHRSFLALAADQEIKLMKRTVNFSNTARIFFVATVTLLLLLTRSTAFAGSATWDSSGSMDWDSNGNWLPNTGYPNGSSDTATFDNMSSVTSIFVDQSTLPGNVEVAAIDFTASETHAFTITVDVNITLTISGTGITNSSGIT